mgnify:CR=1 FL=1
MKIKTKDNEIRKELQIMAKVNAYLEQKTPEAFQKCLDEMLKYIENGGDPEKLNSLLSKNKA